MKVLLIFSLTAFSLVIMNSVNSKSFGETSLLKHSDVKIQAFKILESKCNSCHIKQNKKKVFTFDNMNFFAPKIEEQVFVKKRMPRGRKITLTEKEYQQLSVWIKSLK